MVSIYVAISRNGVIGKQNGLPWYLPSDLARFKQTTMDHPIVMGRKTYESIGRPLPGRTSIVISRNSAYQPEGVQVAHSLQRALQMAKKAPGGQEIFIIGGSTIYEQALPLTERIYLTRVDADIDGDIFFSLDERAWQPAFSEKHQKDQKNQYDYEFVTLRRKP